MVDPEETVETTEARLRNALYRITLNSPVTSFAYAMAEEALAEPPAPEPAGEAEERPWCASCWHDHVNGYTGQREDVCTDLSYEEMGQPDVPCECRRFVSPAPSSGTPGLTKAQREAHKRTPESSPDHIPYCIGFIEGAEWGAAEARAPLEEQGRCEACDGTGMYLDNEFGDSWPCRTCDGRGQVLPLHQPAPQPVADREEAATIIERAKDMVDALCHGRKRWTMSVPARPDEDPDLVIVAGLEAGSRAEEQLAAVMAERDEALQMNEREAWIAAAIKSNQEIADITGDEHAWPPAAVYRMKAQLESRAEEAERQRDEALAALRWIAHASTDFSGADLQDAAKRALTPPASIEPVCTWHTYDAASNEIVHHAENGLILNKCNRPISTAAEEPTE